MCCYKNVNNTFSYFLQKSLFTSKHSLQMIKVWFILLNVKQLWPQENMTWQDVMLSPSIPYFFIILQLMLFYFQHPLLPALLCKEFMFHAIHFHWQRLEAPFLINGSFLKLSSCWLPLFLWLFFSISFSCSLSCLTFFCHLLSICCSSVTSFRLIVVLPCSLKTWGDELFVFILHLVQWSFIWSSHSVHLGCKDSWIQEICSFFFISCSVFLYLVVDGE